LDADRLVPDSIDGAEARLDSYYGTEG